MPQSYSPNNPFAPKLPAATPVVTAPPAGKHSPRNPFAKPLDVMPGEVDLGAEYQREHPSLKGKIAPLYSSLLKTSRATTGPKPFSSLTPSVTAGDVGQLHAGGIQGVVRLGTNTAAGAVRLAGRLPETSLANDFDPSDPMRPRALPKALQDEKRRITEDLAGNIVKGGRRLEGVIPEPASQRDKIFRGTGHVAGQMAPFVLSGAGVPAMVGGSLVNAASEAGTTPEESLLGMVSPEQAKSPAKRAAAGLAGDLGAGLVLSTPKLLKMAAKKLPRNAPPLEPLSARALRELEASVNNSLDRGFGARPFLSDHVGAFGPTVSPTKKARPVTYEEIFTPEARAQVEAAKQTPPKPLTRHQEEFRARIQAGEDLTDAEVHYAEPTPLSPWDVSTAPMPGKEHTTIGAQVKRWRIREGGEPRPAGDPNELLDHEELRKGWEATKKADPENEYGDISDVADIVDRRVAKGQHLDRRNLRAEIATQVTKYGKAEAEKEGIKLRRTKEAVILTGPPAAGKTTISNRIGRYFGAYTIDSDPAKVRNPAYAALGANGTHEESTLSADLAIKWAVRKGDNIVVPGLGRRAESVAGTKKLLEDAGYTVHLVLADLSGEHASVRAFNRTVGKGRVLHPHFVSEVTGNNPQRVYEELTRSGAFGGRHLRLDQTHPPEVPLNRRVTDRGHEFPAEALDETVPRGTGARANEGVNSERGVVSPQLAEPTGIAAGAGAQPARTTPEVHPSELRGPTGREDVTFIGPHEVKTRNRVVEAGELIPSNHHLTFDRRSDYPETIQGRVYHGTAGQGAAERVVEMRANLEPRKLVNPNRSVHGPPVVSGKRVVVAGNQRVMAMQGTSPEQAARLKAQIIQDAELIGVNPEEVAAMERPVLVREIVDERVHPDDHETLRELNELSDRPSGKTKDPLTEAMGRARQLKAESSALEHYSATSSADESLGDYLQGRNGPAFLNKLVEDKVINPAELDGFRDASTGRITKQGRQKISDMMSAAAVGDAAVIDQAPDAIVAKLEHGTPRLVKAAQTEGWSLERDLQEALGLHTTKKANGFRSIDDVLGQGDAFGWADQYGEGRGAVLARFLEGKKKAEVSDAMRQWAEAAEKSKTSGGASDMFGVAAESPDEAFGRIFGGGEPVGAGAAGKVRARRGSVAGPVANDPYNYAALKMLSSMGGGGVGATAGATAGGNIGATPEERRRNRDVGAMSGFAIGLGLPFTPEIAERAAAWAARLRTLGADEPAKLFELHVGPTMVRVKVAGAPDQAQLERLFKAVRANPKAVFRYSTRDLAGRELSRGSALHEMLGDLPFADRASERVIPAGSGTGRTGAVGNQPDMFGHVEPAEAQGSLLGEDVGRQTAQPSGGFTMKQKLAGERAEFLRKQLRRMSPGAAKTKVAQEVAELDRVSGFNRGITKDEMATRAVAGENDMFSRTGAIGNQPRPKMSPPGEPPIPGQGSKAVAHAIERVRQAIQPEEVDDFVNVSKFAVDPTGEKRLRSTVEEVVNSYGLAPKEVITWNQTRELARSLGIDNVMAGDVHRTTGPEALAIRNIVSSNIDELVNAHEMRARLLQAGSGTKEELAKVEALDRLITGVEGQNNQLLGRFIKARSSAGRDLNTFKIIANRSLDPVVWMTKAKKLMGDIPMTEAQQIKITRYLNDGDRVGLVSYMMSLRKELTWTDLDFWRTLRKAGLMSNLKTQVRNFGSNLPFGVLEMVKDGPATVADILTSTLTNTRTKNFSLVGAVEASWKGAKEGARDARSVMKSGVALPDVLTGRDVPFESNFKNKLLDRYTKFVFRSMSAADRPFKQAALKRSLAEQARVLAKAEGLEGAAWKARIQELTDHPTNDMAIRAISDSEHATFQNRSVGGMAAAGLKKGLENIHPAAGFAGDMVIPFVKTPGAVGGKVVEFSPLGALGTLSDIGRLIRASKTGADERALYDIQKRLAERFGRWTTGTFGLAVGYYLAEKGLTSGALPTSTTERDQWTSEGKLPDAVKLNGRWWGLTGISPVGNLVAFGSQLFHNLDDPELETADALAATATGVGKTISEQPFLRGTQGLIEAVKDVKGKSGAYVRDQAGSFLPAGVAGIARAVDPTPRQVSSLADVVKSRIPFASRTLPAKVGPLGAEPARESSVAAAFLQAMVDPFSSRKDRTLDDPIIAEMAKVGARVGRVKKEKGEDAQAFYQRSLEYAAETRQAIEKRVQSEKYARAEEDAAWLIANNPKYKGRTVADVTRARRRDLIQRAATKERAGLTRDRRAEDDDD